MPEETLGRLAALYGIEGEHSVTGGRHAVSDATRRALLEAMGVPARTADEVAQAIEACERQVRSEVLPPVGVVWEGEPEPTIAFAAGLLRPSEPLGWVLTEEDGTRHEGTLIPEETEAAADGKRLFRLPPSLPMGYHRLVFEEGNIHADMDLVVAPGACYAPPALAPPARVWGLATRLYSVRSGRNWGIGDFTDLRELIEQASRKGAALVGVDPLHALFPSSPAHASPYGPSSRVFLNVLYLDVEAIPEFAGSEEAARVVRDPKFQAALRALRAEELVDYAVVAERKLRVLELLYRSFRERHLDPRTDERGQAFLDWRAGQGPPLRDQALFDALGAKFHDSGGWAWQSWPSGYRRRDSAASRAFEAEHETEVEFFEYLYWQAFDQLAAVGRLSEELHLGVGLCQRLSAGIAPEGAEAWAGADLYALGARIGTPPDGDDHEDGLDPRGRDWGLPPPAPRRLREAAYRPFIRTLGANMRFAGAIRIDPVMALARLFWIPAGMSPREGAYVSYPFDDLLGILALESQRNKCLVICDDLESAPQEIRDRLREMGMLSGRLLSREKASDGLFRAPADYPVDTALAVSTLDAGPIAGYWQGADLALRDELGLFPSAEMRRRQIVARAEDRARLLLALDKEALLPQGVSVDPISAPEMTPALSVALHRYIARTPSAIVTVRAEDCFRQTLPASLEGTGEEYPNWRRKLPLDLEEWPGDADADSLMREVDRERRASGGRAGAATGRPRLRRSLPRATYRVQLSREFTFAQAAEIVPYLDALGISHCYASPYLRARPGSHHGYDIIDHNALDPEIGDEASFGAFVDSLREHSMGHLLDMVPNHMAVMGSDNSWWLDVLENGQTSAYAAFFDIDWQPAREDMRGKVLVPVLADHYGSALEQGELQLTFQPDSGAFTIVYRENSFPVDPASYPIILDHGIERLKRRLHANHPEVLEYQAVSAGFGRLPACSETEPKRVVERRRDKEIHKNYLAALVRQSADIAWFLEENVREFNEGAGPGFRLMHGLVGAQPYRLAYWRVAADEINYRRFFDINDLAALRMENEAVFDATHRRVLALLESGRLDGLRIDHPDGLYDPAGYFRRIQSAFGSEAPDEGADGDDGGKPVYLVAEKILAGYEYLPEGWQIHGTTGYDFLNLVNGLFVDHDGEAALDKIYRGFAHKASDFEELAYRNKKLIIRSALVSELAVLANQLSQLAQTDPHTCDFTLNGLLQALTEVVACFPVYRTYVSSGGVGEDDRRYIDWAVQAARRRSHTADDSIFGFIRDMLLTTAGEGKPESRRREIVSWAMRFQQYTAPVMAKSVEDTTFYTYNRLISLNEVGGDPRRFGTSVAAFHQASKHRLQHWPDGMLSTSTHDTKRSEDVRARLDALSEIPEEWRRHLARWTRINRSRKTVVEDAPAPARNDEYLLYQTLVGAWPLEDMDEAGLAAFRERIGNYMKKAIREAKTHTSWINPDEEYEQAVEAFVAVLLGTLSKNRFLAELGPFARRLSRFGMFNSLSQILLKMTSPGVPDFYQGNEIWDFSLVDPDNRRPVDFPHRREMLEGLRSFGDAPAGERAPHLERMLETLEDGRAKLYTIWKTLGLRREHPRLFSRGDYVPLDVAGPCRAHVCAFARTSPGAGLVVLAPRLIARLLGGSGGAPTGEPVWQDTRVELPAALRDMELRNVFTGHSVPPPGLSGDDGGLRLADALGAFPVGLLSACPDRPGRSSLGDPDDWNV